MIEVVTKEDHERAVFHDVARLVGAAFTTAHDLAARTLRRPDVDE